MGDELARTFELLVADCTEVSWEARVVDTLLSYLISVKESDENEQCLLLKGP